MNNFPVILILGGIIFIVLSLIFYFYFHKFLQRSEKKEKISYLRCLDDHIVKSRGELIIDNYLYILGLDHKYEEIIEVSGKKIKCDWFLPGLEVYIEYWGYYSKDYMKRKKDKIKLYKKYNLNLISVENGMFEDIYTYLDSKLQKFIKLDKKNFKRNFCPSCGIELDERFQNSINFI
jgi:predicted nuclease of restriction endonuclease-like RecB superfamily